MFQPDTLRHLLEQSKPEASPYTLEHLAEWIATKGPAGRYCYTDNGLCLIGQYLKSFNSEFVECDPGEWWDNDNARHPLPNGFDDIAGEPPFTFEAALLRTRAAIAARKNQ